MAQRDQIDDLCDARATVRTLRQEVHRRRIALVDAKEKLSTASGRMEDVLTEIEQKQGRLPFPEDQQAAEQAKSNGRRKSRGGDSAGARA